MNDFAIMSARAWAEEHGIDPDAHVAKCKERWAERRLTVDDWGGCVHCGVSHPKARLRVQRGRCLRCFGDSGPVGCEPIDALPTEDEDEAIRREYRIEQRRLTPIRIRQHGIFLDYHFHDTPAGRDDA